MGSLTKPQIAKKPWYIALGFVFLLFVGLSLAVILAPLLIGGSICYLIYKKVSSPKLKYALIALVALPSLFIGSAWASGIFSRSDSSEPIQTAVQSGAGGGLGAGSQGSIVGGGEVAGERVEEPQEEKEDTDLVQVTRVIDGDTIEIEGGQKVRYIGIDTPETVHPEKPIECFGKEASAKNNELVAGKKAKLEKDVSETDKYGRLLRYVWVGDSFVNDYLVRQGYAKASSFPPDIKYQDQFREAEQEARNANRGLWTAGVCEGEVLALEDKDCLDFTTQEEAQAFFISQGGPANDPHRLDADNDGIACESLPSSSQPAPEPGRAPDDSGRGYTCDCSKTCSEMSSCEEAYFQLEQCGCSKRDGDKDGVPCEDICEGGEGPSESKDEMEEEESGGATYTCDCSKTCSEMSSCEEAYYQLNVCGCSKRDGDGDGVPCESICR